MSFVPRTIQVFVSSTFRDMHAERDFLAKTVFPRLREWLAPYHVYVHDIDLRWGISQEQEQSRGVVGLCLDTIEQCHPFFIGFLGERYGTVPSDLDSQGVNDLSDPRTASRPGASITELEIMHGVLGNASAQDCALFFFRDARIIDELPDTKRPDFATENSNAAARLAQLKADIRRTCKGTFEYSGHCVGLAIDRCRAKSELGHDDWVALNRAAPTGFIDRTAYYSLPASQRSIVDRHSHVELDLTDLEKSIVGELAQRIRAALDLPAAPTRDTNPFAQEAAEHSWFAHGKTRVFSGREEELRALEQYVSGTEPLPCLVTGPPGSGKSALVARFVEQRIQSAPCDMHLLHFVGGGSLSLDIRLMLIRFMAELHDCLGLEYEEDVGHSVTAQFLRTLDRVPVGRRVVIVVDAHDQFEDPDEILGLSWLPDMLPEHVRIIVTVSDAADARATTAGIWDHRRVHGLAIGPLTPGERLEVLRRLPSLSAKSLDEQQADLILANAGTGNPLFLAVAVEELRGLASSAQVTATIRALPTEGDPAAMFERVLDRLETECGADLVRTSIGVMCASRYGLKKVELMRLCQWSTGRRHWDASGYLEVDRQIFRAVDSIIAQLRPYLLTLGATYRVAHPSLRDAVEKREEPARVSWVLIEYYREHPITRELAMEDHEALLLRKLTEVPWQLAKVRDWNQLAATISSPSYFFGWHQSAGMRSDAWAMCRGDVLWYWAQMERQSTLRRIAYYRPVLDSSHEFPPAYIGIVSRILRHAGFETEAATLANDAAQRGNPHEMQRALRHAFHSRTGDAAEAFKSELARARTVEKAANVAFYRNDVAEAAEMFREARGLYRAIADWDRVRYCLGGEAEALILSKRSAEALKLARDQELSARDDVDHESLVNSLGTQAWASLETGDVKSTAQLLDEMRRWIDLSGRHSALGRWLGVTVWLAIMTGDRSAALEASRSVLRIAEDRGDPALAQGAQDLIQRLRHSGLSTIPVPQTPRYVPVLMALGLVLCWFEGWVRYAGVCVVAVGFAWILRNVLIAFRGIRIERCPRCGSSAVLRNDVHWHCRQCGSWERT